MTAAALVVYALALAGAAVAVWRRPATALAVFVVGLALHNATMDALHGAGIHGSALTAIQAWKDVLLVVALARVAFDSARSRCLPFRPALPDALALAFGALVVVYAVVPQSALGGHADTTAIAYALRHDLAGVAAYFLGRAVVPDLRRIRPLILVTATAVALWGLLDAYAIDLDWWRHNGTVSYFRDQLGFDYGKGLSGLPENFVYNNGNEHELTRRLISTFLSPLASAYLFVVALLFARRRTWPLAILPVAALLATHTRAAIAALTLALLVVAGVRRTRAPLALAALTLVLGIAALLAFPHVGPRASFTPAELRVQRANARDIHEGPNREPSTQSHVNSLRGGIDTVAQHPQGFGLGNAGEVASREDVPIKAGESNYTELGVEIGLFGALVFVAWNLATLAALVRNRRADVAAALAAILLVAVQTDAYGIPWLAYCLWWLAGSGVSMREDTE